MKNTTQLEIRTTKPPRFKAGASISKKVNQIRIDIDNHSCPLHDNIKIDVNQEVFYQIK